MAPELKKANQTPDLRKFNQLIDRYCTEEWKLLLEQNKTIFHYRRKALIFKEREDVQNICIIKSGKVKVFTTYEKDKHKIIRLAMDGQILGHRGLGEDFVYPVSAAALTDVEMYGIPLSIFQNVLKANSNFCYQLMMFFAEELKRSERQMKQLASMPVRQRVMKAIKMNMEAFGFDEKQKQKLSYTLTRTEISQIAATSYESVVRVLGDLHKEKLIKIDGKSIHVLKKDEIYPELKS